MKGLITNLTNDGSPQTMAESQLPRGSKHQETVTRCHRGREPSTKDDREHFKKREGMQSTLSRGVLEAVVEDDDDARVETIQTEPLGASSSDNDDKTIRQGFATRSRERRPRTRRRMCLLQDKTDTGREQRRLHKTRSRVNHYVRICLERCPLTTRHTAKRSGSVSLLQGFAGLQHRGRSGRRCTIAASLWPSPKADHEWHTDVTNQSDYHSSGTNDFHAQQAEGESGAGEAASGPRAARGEECGGNTVGQHVDVIARSDTGERTAQNNQATAEGGGERRRT